MVVAAAAGWAEAVLVDLALVVTCAALVVAALVVIAMVADLAVTAVVAVDGVAHQQLTAAEVVVVTVAAMAGEAVVATAIPQDQARPLGGKEGAASMASSGFTEMFSRFRPGAAHFAHRLIVFSSGWLGNT